VNPAFNGWKEGLMYYGPVLAIGIVLCLVLRPWGYWWAGIPVVLVGLAMMLFFRDFPRTITATANEVVSPADGTVVAIEDLNETPHYAGTTRRVSIFMSVFSAHVNRAPFECTVKDVRYAPGKYRDARDPDSSKINESNAILLETPKGPMTVRQISGAVARHIVCPVKPGTALKKGEKFGMIRFGSRVELYLPPGTEVLVKNGQKVYAGITLMAKFP
jgi:phosphatidylserine decarboxylase